MPAFTIGATTYPCRVFPKRHVPLVAVARAWDDSLVTSHFADEPKADEFDVEVGVLSESEKNTLVAELRAAGTVDIGGDLPGGTITVKAIRIGFEPMRRQSQWIVTFLAQEVSP